MDYSNLRKQSILAKENSYSPYSHFRVGAALLTKDGHVFTGCNIENAGLTATNCAERTAIFKAISEGYKDFEAIAICGDADDYLYPCGVCRQVMVEFCDLNNFKVILVNTEDDYKEFSLGELMPGAFTPNELEKGVVK
ncbi:cytidine deaminase [Lachnospiraceae bacterium C7]|nr:cytidine deaminase [Lachnospiraceae bacterium C7]